MDIKVLGSGCPKCLTLEENVKQVILELKMDNVQVEHVKDIMKITEYGVMSTPAIVIDGQVKAAGRVPDLDEIKTWLGA